MNHDWSNDDRERPGSRTRTICCDGIEESLEFGVDDAERTRRILEILKRHDAPITVGELTDRLIELDGGGDVGVETRGEIHQQLYRDDLQRLDALGLVRFDGDDGLVYPSIEDVSDASSEHPDSEGRHWLRYYAAVLFATGMLFAGNLFGLSIPTDALLGASSASIAVLAIAQYRH